MEEFYEPEEIHTINPTDVTLNLNLTLYFQNYAQYGRFHYSALHKHARAVVNKCDCKLSRELVKHFDSMFYSPFYYFGKQLPYPPKVYYKQISIARIEYIVFRDNHFNTPLSKPYRLDKKRTIEIGQLIDLLDLYKTKIHENFDAFMTEHNLTPKLIMPKANRDDEFD